jgi:hypothetical protein
MASANFSKCVALMAADEDVRLPVITKRRSFLLIPATSSTLFPRIFSRTLAAKSKIDGDFSAFAFDPSMIRTIREVCFTIETP